MKPRSKKFREDGNYHATLGAVLLMFSISLACGAAVAYMAHSSGWLITTLAFGGVFFAVAMGQFSAAGDCYHFSRLEAEWEKRQSGLNFDAY